MKVILFLLLFVTAVALGGAQTVVRDASVTNIPSAYTGTDGELISSVNANSICCSNHTGSALGVCVSADDAANCNDDWYLVNNAGFCFDNHPLASSVFVKGWSGTVNSGVLVCRVWVRN